MVKRAVLLLRASSLLAMALAAAACGQTGPLYMPTPQQRGIAVPPPANNSTAPASGIVRSQDESQMRQPTPDIVVPRPGTR